MGSYTTQAVCLKTYDYGESSRIIHFYSPDRGLVKAIAKGVKGNKSKLAGACEILNLSRIHLATGKNLDVLCQYESLQSFRRIREDILKLALATLFAELLNLLATEHDTDSTRMYELLREALESLEGEAPPHADGAGDLRLAAIGADYQLRLLNAAGYAPVLDRCIASDAPMRFDRPHYPFSPEQGGVVLERNREWIGDTTLVNVSVETLRVLCNPLAEDWAEASSLKVYRFLQYYFSHKLERRIKAYDFVLELLGGASVPAPAH